MAVKERYYEPEAGEWVRPVMEGYKMSCCDCGLVHTFNFSVKRVDGKYRVFFQVFRDNRATAAIRRWRKKRGEPIT
jgi:hypothetical protein